MYLSIHLSIFGETIPQGSLTCLHMLYTYDCPLFQSYFARMSDVYIANSIKNKVSLLSKGNVHLKP